MYYRHTWLKAVSDELGHPLLEEEVRPVPRLWERRVRERDGEQDLLQARELEDLRYDLRRDAALRCATRSYTHPSTAQASTDAHAAHS